MIDLLNTQETGSSGPVECLGQTFPNDDARREHFLKLLADRLNGARPARSNASARPSRTTTPAASTS